MSTPIFVSHFFAFCHCSCKLSKMKPTWTFRSCLGGNVEQVSTREWAANELHHCAFLDLVANMLVVCWVVPLDGLPFVDLGQECTFCPFLYNEFIHWSLWTCICACGGGDSAALEGSAFGKELHCLLTCVAIRSEFFFSGKVFPWVIEATHQAERKERGWKTSFACTAGEY